MRLVIRVKSNMTAEELWKKSGLTGNYDAWAFGEDADRLAELVKKGIKTATSSLLCFYELEGEELPGTGQYNIILDSQNQAVANTVESFDKIQYAMNELGSSSDELRGLVSSLERANQAIVDGIENISASTEEVTAHSNQTFENNEENLAIAQDINSVINELGNMANKLATVSR